MMAGIGKIMVSRNGASDQAVGSEMCALPPGKQYVPLQHGAIKLAGISRAI